MKVSGSPLNEHFLSTLNYQKLLFHGCLFCSSGLSFSALLHTRCTEISMNAKLVWLRGKKISIFFHVKKVSKTHFLISSYIMWNN